MVVQAIYLCKTVLQNEISKVWEWNACM